ncbi:hypothetical protein UFOVP74_20 [uncultured Caudovirales phage]|uniref:Uncharacterized protein n=1 Tax=uncultured Caudovirales phage TaxID=2100421 RepID=A0A6J5KZT7_9CAUD|nr:hypothetical protein UFOVP74_20 [uncultured Caudovirales phage]
MTSEEILIHEVKSLKSITRELVKMVKYQASRLDELAPAVKQRANWQKPQRWMELTGKNRSQWNYFLEMNKDNAALIRREPSGRYSVNINNL